MSKTKKSLMDNREEEGGENEGGIILEKDDLQLIYKALRKYTPTKKEEHLHGILLEEFEELLEVDYIDIPIK
jgi:hypothetical protein